MIDAGVYPLNLKEDKVGQREEKQEGLENAGRGTFAAEQIQSSYPYREENKKLASMALPTPGSWCPLWLSSSSLSALPDCQGGSVRLGS